MPTDGGRGEIVRYAYSRSASVLRLQEMYAARLERGLYRTTGFLGDIAKGFDANQRALADPCFPGKHDMLDAEGRSCRAQELVGSFHATCLASRPHPFQSFAPVEHNRAPGSA